MPKLTKTGYQIGSSEAGAIVLYKTAFQTRDEILRKHKLARKGVETVAEIQNKRALRRGTHLEPAVAEWATEDFKAMTDAHVEMEEPKAAFIREELGIASSVDRIVTLNAPLVLTEPDGSEVVLYGKGICEIKTDFYHKDKPKPEWIIQVLHQMLCVAEIWPRKTDFDVIGSKSSVDWGVIACMCQRGKMHYYPVTYNQHLFDRMIEAYDEFWELVKTDGEYPPLTENKDDPVNIDDYDPVVTEVFNELCSTYTNASRLASEANKQKEDAKAAILDALDGLEEQHVQVGNFTIKHDETLRERKSFVGTGDFYPSNRLTVKETN